MMTYPVKVARHAARVSAEQVAAILASDHACAAYRRGVVRTRVMEREAQDVLPAGHSVSWGAIWGAGEVPAFPGLQALEARDRGVDL